MNVRENRFKSSSQASGKQLAALAVLPDARVADLARNVRASMAAGARREGVVRQRSTSGGEHQAMMAAARGRAAWLCAEIEPKLIGALTLYCGDRGVAEELAQETLVRILDRWGQVRQLDNPAAWAHRVAINLANSRFRRLRAERRARQRLAGYATRDHGRDVAAHIAVRDAVARLPKRQRTALVLRYFADLPVAEVATLMDCSTGTVKSLTHHAIAALRRMGLVDDDEEMDRA